MPMDMDLDLGLATAMAMRIDFAMRLTLAAMDMDMDPGLGLGLDMALDTALDLDLTTETENKNKNNYHMTHAEQTEIIESFLKEKNMTRKDLIEATGFSKTYIDNVLSGGFLKTRKKTPGWFRAMVFVLQNRF